MTILNFQSPQENAAGLGLFPSEGVPKSFAEVAAANLAAAPLQAPVGLKDFDIQQGFDEREKMLRDRFQQDPLELTGINKKYPNPSFDGRVEMMTEQDGLLNQMIADGRTSDPEKWAGIRTSDEIRAGVAQEARQQQEAAAQVTAQAATPFDAVAGSLVGNLAGAFTDPINLATLPFGAPAGVGILRSMGYEALLNMGVEAAETPLIAKWKQAQGMDYGIADAATDIFTAGAGAAGLTGLIKGGAKALEFGYRGFKKLDAAALDPKMPSEARDAAMATSRTAHIDENTPSMAPTREDVIANRQAVNETQDAFRSFRDPAYPSAPESLMSYDTRARADIDALATRAITDDTHRGMVTFGNVAPEAAAYLNARLLDKRGDGFRVIDVNAFDHTASADDLRHAWNTHGEGHEQNPENIPLQKSDFQRIPDIVAHPDRVEIFSTGDKRPAAIRYEQRASDGTHYVVEHTLTGKERLAFKTMYKTRDAEKSGSDLLPGERAKNIRPVDGAKPNGSHTINITNAPAPDKHLVERPNNALKSLQSAAEAAEAPAAKDALNADFQRLLKENPDMKITTEDGREISLADLKKELGENDAIINAVRTCAI